MPSLLRPLAAGLLSFTLLNCQCGQPAVEDPCVPEFCAGCCVDGMCRACAEPEVDGGSLPDAGGPSGEDGGVDAGPGPQPDAGVPDAGGGTGGGMGGGAGGGTGGGAGGGGGGQPGPVFFDGGWMLPVLPPQPALVGDGGTTVVVQGGVDPSAPGKFGGAPTGGAISVAYPPDGVMLPPNTNSIEFHFVPAAGQTLFRFTFIAPTTTLEVYTGCTPVGGGCVFTPDGSFWSSLVAYARGTVPVKWTVSGVNGASPGNVGSSTVQSLSFTEQDLTGGLYYWDSAGSVVRYDYGYPYSPRQTFLDRATAGATTCVGCHVISRQGNLVAVGKDIPMPAAYSVMKVVSRSVASSTSGPLTGGANFFSFSPDEKYMLQSNGAKIEWRDLVYGTTQQVSNQGTMPDWSPDGASMVYVKPPSSPFPIPGLGGVGSPGVQSGTLMTQSFTGTGFGSPQVLVPSNGKNNYYPSYSPDGEWVLYNHSPSNTESMTNAAPADGGYPDGELWAVDAQGGMPVKLAAASAPGACSWPKWAPVRHDYAGGQVMWLTFSSARAYGLRLADWQKTQLWMVAFDPTRIRNGQDPSFPAFWLPFQDMGTGNHIGQWSTTIPRGNCTTAAQCNAGEVCQAGKCRPG
ncbi:MAG: PD40 domain-containing protein [Deltaproteobacteria bacterium]|nr:PD40 domain-containing protein [Deltaproteobacteria bacterium]